MTKYEKDPAYSPRRLRRSKSRSATPLSDSDSEIAAYRPPTKKGIKKGSKRSSTTLSSRNPWTPEEDNVLVELINGYLEDTGKTNADNVEWQQISASMSRILRKEGMLVD